MRIRAVETAARAVLAARRRLAEREQALAAAARGLAEQDVTAGLTAAGMTPDDVMVTLARLRPELGTGPTV